MDLIPRTSTLKRDMACVPCKKSKIKCDSGRPCRRCLLKGIPEECVNQPSVPAEIVPGIVKAPACERCHRLKAKCDGLRPCMRCMQQNVGVECRDREKNRDYSSQPSILFDLSSSSSDDLGEIERPIEFSYDPFERTDISAGFSGRYSSFLPNLLRIVWENQGVSVAGAEKIYTNLPTSVQKNLHLYLGALEYVLDRSRGEQGNAHTIVPVRLDGWQKSVRCGFQAIAMDSSTSKWATCAVNEWLAEFAGVHREEMLARMANQNMQLASTELRQLCGHLMFLIHMSQYALGNKKVNCSDKTYFYSRWNKNFAIDENPEGVLMRACFTLHADDDGNVTGLTRSIVAISEEEYNLALDTMPVACEYFVSQIVGKKYGKELMSRKLVNDEKIETIASDPQGFKNLEILNDIMDRHLRHVLSAAIAQGFEFSDYP
ncbi:hypothetical protein GUITHDRAFT_107672 [Guillardia theta CCMP2712]|uniref:Zn(2)-C6 fungal-type domain-containing protein n=1 Tax=Guillardia theta (strain CCMP2712) TaxID=905079 RepID=L1JD58_GUITC|nr:hypothetical protein GUITHDRAFT_107672 [Guillardia theta CCMP2712]EKX46468.1 hypothetical protein GUITHDRAFT_107672 [Guillardia theta CCMP2712]|eukprot:XP_005833448.1 hypothetical protein GUITHDRAFT_107672 [Guillardia theta CCMP2712]